jgi:hypothetical protein
METWKLSSHLWNVHVVAEPIDEGAKSALASQLLQKYQMVPDRARHRRVLPIRNPKLFGSLPDDPGQRSVVSVAHERA